LQNETSLFTKNKWWHRKENKTQKTTLEITLTSTWQDCTRSMPQRDRVTAVWVSFDQM